MGADVDEHEDLDLKPSIHNRVRLLVCTTRNTWQGNHKLVPFNNSLI